MIWMLISGTSPCKNVLADQSIQEKITNKSSSQPDGWSNLQDMQNTHRYGQPVCN